jgi:AraC family transcriptional regulator
MVRATELLAGPAGITDIAAATGFASLAAFTHAFSSRFGMTPRAFARLSRAG